MGEEDDGPKRGDGEYCGQDGLRGLGLVPVEGVVGELWGGCERGKGEGVREGRVPDWRQRYRGRGASWPSGSWGREDWAQRGGIYTERGPGGSEADDGWWQAMGGRMR